MDYNDFKEHFDGAPLIDTPPRRQPLKTTDRQSYKSYNDIRGNQARDISVAMGIDEESGIARTGHLIELRQANDHIRLSAHAATYAREVLLYADKSVITIDLDRVKEEAIQTVYSPNGDIETLRTGWSYQQNGYHEPFQRVSLQTEQQDVCDQEWSKYETLVHDSLVKIGANRHLRL